MVLILAYGNSLRRDDGAGFVLGDVVERMLSEAGLQVKRIDSHQLEPELALDISGEKISSVLFIDTRALPETPGGDNLRVQFRRVASAQNASPSMGHHLDPPNPSRLLPIPLQKGAPSLAGYRSRNRFRSWRRVERDHPEGYQFGAGNLD